MQHQPGNQVKENKKHLVYPQERIKDQIKSFPGKRKPPAMYTVYKVSGHEKDQGKQNQETHVNKGAPHQKCRECLNIHYKPPSETGEDRPLTDWLAQKQYNKAARNGITHGFIRYYWIDSPHFHEPGSRRPMWCAQNGNVGKPLVRK
jgi:hypothetical protein